MLQLYRLGRHYNDTTPKKFGKRNAVRKIGKKSPIGMSETTKMTVKNLAKKNDVRKIGKKKSSNTPETTKTTIKNKYLLYICTQI